MAKQKQVIAKSQKEPPEIKMFITDSGRLFSEKDLKQFELPQHKESKQLNTAKFKDSEVIQPPYSLEKLMIWLEMSTAHAACVATKVQDSVGIGYKLTKLTDGANETEKEALMAFFSKVNPSEDLVSLSKKVFLDYEGCGNGYIEVARDEKNKISALYHVPAITVRLHKEKNKYMQIVGNQKVYFKIFGSKDAVNKITGKVGEVASPDMAANEIIHLKTYTWRSSYYGCPEWLPALFHMVGEQKEKEYNLSFFSNFGIPAYAVIVKGGTLNPETEEAIKKYFKTEAKDHPHETLVFATPQGAEVTFEPLNVQAKEASFRVYRRDNRDDILTAHRVPPYRAGIVQQGQLGGSVTTEIDKIYLASVINPRQHDYEWIINQLIMQEGFEIKDWKFEFEDILIDERKLNAEIDQMYFRMGVYSPNELREKLGLEPYEGGDAYYTQVNPTGNPEQFAAGGSQVIEARFQEKARLTRGQKQIQMVETAETKSLRKEFTRQGRELLKFLNDGILKEIQADAMSKHPEIYEEKSRRNGTYHHYESIRKASKDDLKAVDKFITGWKDKVKPENVAPILKTFAKRAGNVGGQEALRQLGYSVKFDLKNPELLKKIDERGDKITGGITEKTLDDFRSILADGFYENGDDIAKVSRDIKNLFDETYDGRSETIARTETAIAVTEVQFETYQRNGVAKKRWLAKGDDRVRETHRDAADQGEIPIDENFVLSDGDEMYGPHDPSGRAENVINCRCTLLGVADEDQLPDVAEWFGE